MPSPFISVIIPCYKTAQTMRQTIDSVLDQGRQDIEVVVVNDGSPDEVREIALSYGDKIRYFEQENGGISSARALGISKATGEFLHFLDSDDFLLEDSYEKYVTALQEDETIDVIYSNWIMADEEGHHLYRIRAEEIGSDTALELFRQNRLANLATLSRARLVRELGGFDGEISGSEDWDLWIRLARQGARFKQLDQYTCVYRWRMGSLSRSFLPMWLSLRSIQTKHHDLIKGLPNANAFIREQIEDLLDRDLKNLYGSDQDKLWIQRRINRTKKLFYVLVKAPDLLPHMLRRAYKLVGRRFRTTS